MSFFSNTALVSSDSATIDCSGGYGTVFAQITGTWSGNLFFESTINGTDWFSVSVTNITVLDGQIPNFTAANGIFAMNASGLLSIRVRANGITGTANVAFGGTPSNTIITATHATTFVEASITDSALPTGAATEAKQTQPGIDIGDVTINNAAGASAVNIQDGGNSITVDGTISVSADEETGSHTFSDPEEEYSFSVTGFSSLRVQFSDITIGTVQFQGSVDDLLWNDLFGTDLNKYDGQQYSSTVDEIDHEYQFNVAGLKSVKFISWGGTPTIKWISSTFSSQAITVIGTSFTNASIRDADGAYLTSTLISTKQSLDVNLASTSLPLPTGAATAALQTQPGVDIGDVTINNAAGASAVNIQDGGNSITVDGSVTVTQATGTNLHAVIDSGTISTITNVVHVDDNSSSLTVDGTGNFTVVQATGSNLHSVIDSGTVTTVSTVTNLSQLGGTAISMNSGTRDAGTQRVTIATNDAVPITDNSGSITVDNAGTFAVQLAANQSVNTAQVNGNTTVASVTGVQDVMPRKRTGATGLSPNYSSSHITAKTTTTPTSATAYVSAIVIACSGAGTAWTMIIRDKQGTPAILVPSFTLTVPSTGSPIILQFAEPIIMTSGIDIVTGGTTAGTVDVFITYWQ